MPVHGVAPASPPPAPPAPLSGLGCCASQRCNTESPERPLRGAWPPQRCGFHLNWRPRRINLRAPVQLALCRFFLTSMRGRQGVPPHLVLPRGAAHRTVTRAVSCLGRVCRLRRASLCCSSTSAPAAPSTRRSGPALTGHRRPLPVPPRRRDRSPKPCVRAQGPAGHPRLLRPPRPGGTYTRVPDSLCGTRLGSQVSLGRPPAGLGGG